MLKEQILEYNGDCILMTKKHATCLNGAATKVRPIAGPDRATTTYVVGEQCKVCACTNDCVPVRHNGKL